ncbi:MAG: hypothetical protein ACI9QA_000451 [Methanobacteriota archaeon]
MVSATALILNPSGTDSLGFSEISPFSTFGVLVWAGSLLSVSWIYMVAGKTTYRLKFRPENVDLSDAYNRLVDLHGGLFISVYFVVASFLLLALGMIDSMGVAVNLIGAVGVILAMILVVTLVVGWAYRRYRRDMMLGESG